MPKMRKNKNLPQPTFTTKVSASLELIAIICMGMVLNATIQDSARAAGVIGSGTAASCTDAALTTALAGGGNVTFNCGTSPVAIAIASEKVIAANTVVDGGNLVTLSGGGSQRIFNMQNNIQLTVKNITFADGNTNDQGAAIKNGFGGTLIVSNSKFNNNVTTIVTVFGKEEGGGAIFSGPLGTLIVDKSTFTGNQATGGVGGAIRGLNSNVTVTNSTFTNNQALNQSIGAGGAIYVDAGKGENGKIILRGSTFTNNTAAAFGGAFFNSIYNNNQTLVENCIFTGNTVGVSGSSTGQGGAIWSTGDIAAPSGTYWTSGVNTTTFTVKNTTVSGNTAREQGGGIWIARHPAGTGATIANSTISDNIATNSNGGGIVLGDKGKLNITNSTIYGNKALGNFVLGGGIVVSDGQANITNATIAGNYSAFQAGGIANINNNAPVTLTNTIIANNKANNGGNNATWGEITQNCFKTPMTNGGNNLQFPAPIAGDIDCAAGIQTADPKLGLLTNNGGLTLTMPLLTGSPAINNASPLVCPTTDQRGVARPQGGVCDIGAFEAK